MSLTWVIDIDGIDQTGADITLDLVQIEMGASSQLEPNDGSTAVLQVVQRPKVGGVTLDPSEWVGRILQISVNGTACFYGLVTSQNTTRDEQGNVLTDLQAMSTMSWLANWSTNGEAMLAERETDRVIRLASQLAKGLQWNQAPSAATWIDITSAYNYGPTWADMAGTGWHLPSLNVYGAANTGWYLDSIAAGPQNLSDFLYQLAVGGSAWLGEDPATGAIWYYTKNDLSTLTYSTLNISGCATAWATSSTDLTSIYNDITLTGTSGTSWSVSDAASQAKYGRRHIDVDTQLFVVSSLPAQANARLAALKEPPQGFSMLTVDYTRLPSMAPYLTLKTPICRTFTGLPSDMNTVTQYQIRGISLTGTSETLFGDWILGPKTLYA